MMVQTNYQTINRKLQQNDYLGFTQTEIANLINYLGGNHINSSWYQEIINNDHNIINRSNQQQLEQLYSYLYNLNKSFFTQQPQNSCIRVNRMRVLAVRLCNY